MNWITAVWAMLIGGCIATALPQFLIWIWQRRIVHLLFVILTAAVVALLSNELVLMHSSSVEQFARALQWRQLPLFVMFVAIIGFVRLYFGTGRWWLGITACGVRLACLVINFALPPNLYFREITVLRPAHLLGDTVLAPVGVVSPWSHLTELSSLFLLAFVVDASISLWQQGKPEARRRALIIGGSITSYEVLAAGLGTLVHLRSMPALAYLNSLPFVAIVAAMAFELSYDLLRAAQLVQRFQASQAALLESEARINLAASAANLGLWLWNIRDDKLWVTEKWRRLFGFAESEPVNFDRLLQVVHPEDRERTKQLVQHMFQHGGGEYENEYRITRPDGSTRWMAGYGSVELDERGKPAFARGVSRDITKRKIAEEELRESEARFRTVADAAPVLIWMSGTDKLCNFFNEPWLEFTGRTIEQEMGNGWAEGVHPDDLQRCLQTYTAAFDARQPFVMEYRLRRHDGEYRWISDNGVPRYDTHKNFTGYIGSCVDITESISKGQALRESEERMSLAMDAAKLGLWEWNVSKDELWGTKERRALLGLPPSGKIKLEDALSRVHVDDRDRVRHALKDAARTGKEYYVEYRVVLPDGSARWTEHRGRCVGGADGKDLVLRGVSIDVTEQKRAEEKFRLAVEASPSGVLLVNQTGQIVLVNSQIEELFGYGHGELIGHAVEILVPQPFASEHAEHRAKFFAAPTARAMGAGRELFGRRKDGSEFPVEIGLSPIQTSEGTLVLAAVVDITARKQAELEHQRQNTELARVGRVAVMGELAASLAHEVNNPIAAMVSNASAGQRLIAAGEIETKELNDLFADIVADGRRAGEIVQGIRNMVRKGEARRSLVPIDDTIQDLLRMVHADAIGREVKVTAEVGPDVGQVWGDPVQLLQVLLNLTINAFEAMTDVRPDARRLAIWAGRDGNGDVLVSVRDSGPGFPSGVAEQLFEPFFSTKVEGTGMGLAIARSIIEAHGGIISAENCDGQGACFTLRLPQAKEDNSKAP